MNVHIFRTRMAMHGNHYAYDALVPVADCPHVSPYDTTTICRDNGRFYRFDVATRPVEHWTMEKGWERYQAACDHEKASEARALELAKQVFPELAPAEKWPTLWVEIPTFDARHAEKVVRYAQ